MSVLQKVESGHGVWQQTCRIKKVIQEDRFGCGVACLAMINGSSYPAARGVFVELGIGQTRRRQFSSNFRQLRSALSACGIASKLEPWKGWDSFAGIGIIAVDPSPEATGQSGWHWIVAEKHEQFGVVIHDPDCHLPSFRYEWHLDVECHGFENYIARKSWIRILHGTEAMAKAAMEQADDV